MTIRKILLPNTVTNGRRKSGATFNLPVYGRPQAVLYSNSKPFDESFVIRKQSSALKLRPTGETWKKVRCPPDAFFDVFRVSGRLWLALRFRWKIVLKRVCQVAKFPSVPSGFHRREMTEEGWLSCRFGNAPGEKRLDCPSIHTSWGKASITLSWHTYLRTRRGK